MTALSLDEHLREQAIGALDPFSGIQPGDRRALYAPRATTPALAVRRAIHPHSAKRTPQRNGSRSKPSHAC